LGISCDWNLNYSTIDSESRKISQNSFLDLYKIGRAYRKDAPSIGVLNAKQELRKLRFKIKRLILFLMEI
jgi:leucyl-tRNA synthetase